MRRWVLALLVLCVLIAAMGAWTLVIQQQLFDRVCSTTSLRYARFCWEYEFGKTFQEDKK